MDKNYAYDKSCLNHFITLKNTYKVQRQTWEEKWNRAEAIYLSEKDLINKVYNGNADFHIPIIHWKTFGIYSRFARAIFRNYPFFRIDDLQHNAGNKTVVDFWNKYIQDYQLNNIEFQKNYKECLLTKNIYGSFVAKITQEFQTEEFTYLKDEEPEEITIKDDTYFRPILLTEFYSDVNFPDINESDACIHSTVVTWEQLYNDRVRYEKTTEEVTDENGMPIIANETTEKKGFYENLNLLQLDGDNITQEQEEYAQFLNLSNNAKKGFIKSLQDIKKTGYVHLDECYGKYYIDGKLTECIVTIAEGKVIIRKQATPFLHRRYKRPFIVGRYKKIPKCLYGVSNVILAEGLNAEYQASRQQASDSKSRSIANMWYQDMSKSVSFDGIWSPNKVIKGNGQNGLTPLINPYLGNITNADTQLLQRDLDQLFNLSPVQEGTSDNRLIPGTATGTQRLIAENDIPLNELIQQSVEEEIKPFLEMLIERNFVYKDIDDLKAVFDEKEMAKYQKIWDSLDKKGLIFTPNIKILGNYELSNEASQQTGYMALLNVSQQVPVLAKMLKWTEMADRLAKSFGIKDDAWDLFYDMESVIEEEQLMQQQKNEQSKAQLAMAEKAKQEQIQSYDTKKAIDTNAKVQEMIAEARIEQHTGQKVQ